MICLQFSAGLAWYIPMKESRPWRKPLRERQANAVYMDTWPYLVPRDYIEMERGTYGNEGVMDYNMEPEIYLTRSTIPTFKGTKCPLGMPPKLSLQVCIMFLTGFPWQWEFGKKVGISSWAYHAWKSL